MADSGVLREWCTLIFDTLLKSYPSNSLLREEQTMPASCCGGEFNLFAQTWIHKRGCPKNQPEYGRREAERKMEEGKKDAFGPKRGDLAGDPSYELGRKREEQRRVDHIVENVWGFPIGGKRRRR